MNQLKQQPFRPRHLLALLLLSLLLGACGRRGRSIHPVIATPDPETGGALVLGQPILVSFTALNDDASANLTETQFRNQLVRVTGAFVPSEPLRCGGEPRNGPVTGWAMVAENLRLEVAGLDDVVELVPEGTQMTVEGYWRVYEGPVGCGKEPPSALRFYLDARQIIAPNPLPIIASAGGESLEVPAGEGNGGTEGPGSGGIGTPAPPETPSPGTFGPTGTPGGQVTASATPTRIGDDLTPATTATTTPSATPTLTATGGPSPTPSRTGTPTRTPTAGPSPTPSPTSTPLGQATPEPTSTGNPYPLPTPSSTVSPTPGY